VSENDDNSPVVTALHWVKCENCEGEHLVGFDENRKPIAHYGNLFSEDGDCIFVYESQVSFTDQRRAVLTISSDSVDAVKTQALLATINSMVGAQKLDMDLVLPDDAVPAANTIVKQTKH
jgi:hypothetical protein